ncbi:single-stranded DNA-binding protein [Leucobacter chinensis]|uniref:single-stranded DNA-binding protein n=1 Tax=Leucobacter chinensis TaxID=2851010 RepID=UPI001C230E8A|nr:hypothetical protein [Leucobacter chinensis]
MEAIKGNIGKEIKFFPQDQENGKDALAIISLAEKKFAPPTYDMQGKPVWAEPETIWHNDVMVRGSNAVRFNETFQAGDPIIVVGQLGKETQKELADGRVVTSTSFWVDSFGFDGTRVKAQIDRTPHQTKANTRTQTAEQTNQRSVGEQPRKETAAEADISKYRRASQKLEHRLGELVEAQRMSEQTEAVILAAFADAATPEEAQISVNAAVMQARLPMTEYLYLTSVMGEGVGDGPALSWRDAEKLHSPENMTVSGQQPIAQSYAR